MKKSIIVLLLIIVFLLCSCMHEGTDVPLPEKQPFANGLYPIEQTVFPSEVPTLPTEPATLPTRPADDPEYSETGYYPVPLMYHLILEEPYNDLVALFVKPSEFDKQLTAMSEAGYSYLFANDYSRRVSKCVMVTFDDGYEDNYTEMFPILKAHGAKATIFLISNMLDTPGYLTTEQVKEMAQSGLVYFGCHTANHNDLATLSEEQVRSEFSESVAKIESITGQKCTALAYPSGSYNKTVLSVASEFFDYAYLARQYVSDGVKTDLKIPRIYVGRDLTAGELVRRIGALAG